MTPVRTTVDASQADEWALVLHAAEIAHRVQVHDAGWAILVAAEDAARARRALDDYDADAATEAEGAATVPAPARGGWAPGLLAAALLVAFFTVTGAPAGESRWFARGAAAAGAMLAGEPWRAVTALTLHADAAHVAGNAAAIALLLPGIVQRLGPGAACGLVLLAGAAGNLLAALAHGPGHVAVGASTATFAALGILASWRLRAPEDGRRRGRSRRWAVPVAAVVLLLTSGVGPRTDVLAHGGGLLAGAALGLVAGRWPAPPAPVQWALGAAVVLVVLGCWRLALGGAPG